MHQKITRYILLTIFFLIFPYNSNYIEVPLKLSNEFHLNKYSFKQNSFYSTYFPLLSDKKTKKNDTKIGYSTFSYLNQLENNLLIYEAKLGSDEQLFKVILDTGSSILWIPGIGSEDKSGNISHHYNPNTSLTSKKLNRSYKIRYGSGYSLGYYYYDQIKLFNNTNNSNFSFFMYFGVANKTNFNVPGADGVLGLGKESTLLNYSTLYCLKNHGFIDKEGFSIKYNNDLKNAVLFFGDEHEDFKNNNVAYCSLASKTYKERKYWTCKLFSFGIVNNKLNLIINLNLSVIFDTGTNAIVMPRYILSFLQNELKKIDCFINELSLEINNIICYNKSNLTNIVFEFGDYFLTLSNYIYYEEYLQNGTKIYFLNIYFEEGIEMGIIGLPFFFEFHTRFDLDKNMMKFYHTNYKNINKSLNKNNTNKYDKNKKDINVHLKILIIILSLITFILIFIIIKYKYCCKKQKKSNQIEKLPIISSDLSEIL